MSADLTAFLAARLDEDEAAAKATAPSGRRWTWRTDVQTDDDERAVGYCVVSWPDVSGVAGAWGLERDTGQAVAAHIARHDPARVLREVEAKRRMLADLDLTYPDEEFLVKLLAAIWSDHPDYRQEWAP